MPEGLRFVFVTTFYPPHHFGGDAVLVRHMAEALARAGHRVDVVYDADAYRALRRGAVPDPPAPPSAGGRGAGEVRVHALHSRLGPLSPLLTHQLGRPVVHRRTMSRLLEGDVDVVHFHNVSLAGGPGIFTYGRALKLYTAHEHWLVCPTHVLWRHRREPCAERQCLRCLLHYRRPPQLWRSTGLLDRAARQVDAFCSPSRFSIDKHRELGFEHPIRLLPPFLPDEPWAGASDGAADPAAPIFLFVGRLERIKGLDDVIPHFTRGDGRSELWIAGSGGEEEALRRLAGGAPRVRFLGWVAPDRVRGLLRQACALVVPSAGFEVFPLVLLEAFRERTPVIARRLGPLPEVVEDAGGGLTFATPEELSGAIDRLSRDPALARELGERARRSYESRWTESAFLRSYLGLVAQLARDQGRTEILRRLGGHEPRGDDRLVESAGA